MELFFKHYGDDGPPLVILHGLLGASGNWHTLSSRAFAPHFSVYAVDQRNHGRSPHADAFDYPTMADDLAHFMDRHDLAAAHLLGHSMGGKTAMHFALAHPDRVRRLIVVDIAPKRYPARHAEIIDALRATDPAAFASRQEIDAALARHIPSLPIRQFLLKNLEHDGQGGYSWKMNLDAIHRHYDRINVGLEAEGTFDGPTRFIRGGASDYVDEGDLPRIRRHFPQAELVTIPKAGHWVHAEAPQPFAEAVLDFLGAGTTAQGS